MRKVIAISAVALLSACCSDSAESDYTDSYTLTLETPTEETQTETQPEPQGGLIQDYGYLDPQYCDTERSTPEWLAWCTGAGSWELREIMKKALVERAEAR